MGPLGDVLSGIDGQTWRLLASVVVFVCCLRWRRALSRSLVSLVRGHG